MNKYKNLLCVALISIVLCVIEVLLNRIHEGWIFLSLIGLLWWGYQIIRYKQFTVSSILIVGIFTALYVIAMIPFSYSLPLNLIAVFRTILFVFLSFLVYVSLIDESSRVIWENSLILAGVLAGIFSLLEVFIWFGRYSWVLSHLQEIPPLAKSFRISGFIFDHPNILAGYMNFVWPIMFVRMVSSKTKSKRLLWIAGIALCALTLYFAISRGGLIGALVGVFYFSSIPLLSSILSRSRSKGFDSYRRRQFIRQILIVSIMLALFSVAVLWRAIESKQINIAGLKSKQFLTFVDSLSSGRGRLWKYSWNAFQEAPIYGHGNGGFPLAYSHVAKLPPGFFAPSAHNLWLNALVEYGVIGFILLNCVIVLFIALAARYLSKKERPTIRYTDAYLAGGLAFLVHHFFDSMLWAANYSASLLIILILLIRYAFYIKEWKISRRLYIFLGMTFLLLITFIIYSISTLITSSSNYQSLVKQQELGEELQFQDGICSLADRYPKNALYHFECSITYDYR